MLKSMTFKEQLQLRSIKDLEEYQKKVEEVKATQAPFMVECIDDSDFFYDWMGKSKRKMWFCYCIKAWDRYTVDEIKTTRNGKEVWRVGKGYYDPDRFIILD